MTQILPQSFLELFFGEGNAIKWSNYETSAPTDQIRNLLEPWVVRLQKNQTPFCLPRVNTESKQTSWYVLCVDSRQVRSVRETLQSFIGPTYATFNGELATLSKFDIIDQLCQKHFGAFVFRLPITDNKDRPNVNSLLTSMMEFRDRESTISLTTVKPIGRLLRDLEMAIIAHNENGAYQIYAEVRSRGRLSATNLSFLQVHIYASFQLWAEILNMPNLNDLLQVRRPKRISEYLATAVYLHFFQKHEELNEVSAAIDCFRNVSARYQVLVRSIDGMQSPEAIKFAILSAVTANPPNQQLAEQLLKNNMCESDRPWCEGLIAKIKVSKSIEILSPIVVNYDLAETCFNNGHFDEAFELYLQQAPTIRSLSRILEVAVEIDNSVAAEKAIKFLALATDDIRDKTLGRRVAKIQVEFLTNILGKSDSGDPIPILSLEEWFQCVDKGKQIENLKQILEYGVQGWVTGLTFNSVRTVELLRMARTGIQAETIRNTLPIFLNVFLVDGKLTRENKPIYNALIDLLIYDEIINSDDLSAVEQLIEAILTTGPSTDPGKNDFIFAFNVIKHLWETVAAPRHLDWVLSILDLLIDMGTPNHVDLSPIFSEIVNSCRLWTRRVSENQWSLLDLLASDLGLNDLLLGIRPSIEEDVTLEPALIRTALKGKSIAVYSITERIARRFGQLAEKFFDGIKIAYIHDKALTDRMKSLAQNADIFIINTWDAKHAATNGIKANRKSKSITIEPKSKSANSLYSCLCNLVIDKKF